MRYQRTVCFLVLIGTVGAISAADWRQFRGPGGLGTSDEKGLPVEWSAKKNIAWTAKLPGAGASCPVVQGNRVFVTCYSGYALDTKEPGKMDDLRRHLLCVDRATGKTMWVKEFQPVLPEHKYAGEGAYHGYAASTPIVDGDRLYVFFGKSGVYCFDLDGKEVWHTLVGKNTNGWGSGASPILYKDTLIVNASVESGALVALNKTTGKEVWQSPGIRSAWNTPVLVTLAPGGRGRGEGDKKIELVVSIQDWVVGVDPDTGKELWRAEGVHRYVCPSVVAHDGVVYAIGGGSASTAIKAGGKGDDQDPRRLAAAQGIERRFADLSRGPCLLGERQRRRSLLSGGGHRQGRLLRASQPRFRPDLGLADPRRRQALLRLEGERHLRGRRPAEVPAARPQRHRRRQEPLECLTRRQRRRVVSAQRSVPVLHQALRTAPPSRGP